MTKTEFEKLAGTEISNEQYERIETVYMWHPAISNVDGKKQIVQLWRLGVIPDLLPKAHRLRDLDLGKQAIIKAQQDEIDAHKEAVAELEKRHLHCLAEMQVRLDKLHGEIVLLGSIY